MSKVIDILRDLGREVLAEREIKQRKSQADQRRALLVAAGYSTYVMATIDHKEAIICLCCGLGSHFPLDIEHKFCSFCLRNQSEWTAKEPS